MSRCDVCGAANADELTAAECRYHRGHRAESFRAESFRAELFKCEGSFSTSARGAIVITRWSSTDSVTRATNHVSPSRTSVSPTLGTRSVVAYSQAPDGKRIVKDSEATGLLPPLDLAQC